MKRNCFHRMAAGLLVLCLLLSLLPGLLWTAAAEEAEGLQPTEPVWAPALPAANSQPRHQVCTELSAQAQSYYTGSYTYEALSALPGAASNYDSYAACQDNALYTALQTLMSSTHTYSTSYSGTSAGSLAYYWAKTDAVSSGSTYVMFYCDEDGSIGNMEREHIWPKSRASYYQKNGGSDLHHLRPSYGSLNSAKSNHRFGNVVGVYAGYTEGKVNNKVCYWVYSAADLFECKDDVKGDVARILLYVYVRWGQPNLYSEVSSDYLPAPDSDDSQNTGLPSVESLETLLQWCENDPVDSWEMERNDLIQQIQGNRNVFIDYPELAWLMFGETVPAGMQTPSSPGCTHSWTETGRTEPTCTMEGTVTLTCSECGAVRTEVLPALGHVDENRDNLCDRCGAAMSAFVLSAELPDGARAVIYYPAGETTFSLETTAQPRVKPIAGTPEGDRFYPTEEMAIFTAEYPEGETERFRLKCQAGYLTTGESGNRLSYTESPDDYSLWYLAPADAADSVYLYSANAAYNGVKNQAVEYYSNGFTVYGLSETSNKSIYTFRLYVDNPVHTHTWVLTETVPPTCTEGGYELYTCACGETKTEHETAPLGHAWETVVTAPTCTEAGYSTSTCTRCGLQTVEDETAALGHSWDEGTVTLAPTADAEGIRTYTCLRCHETRTEPIPALGAFRFEDVSDPEQYYFTPVYWAVNHEPAITRGISATRFGPDNPCTRAQVVTFLWKACGCPEPVSQSNPFTDVAPTAYYYKAVLWAVEHHVTSGTGAGLFSPDATCTRAQVMTFLWTAVGRPEPASDELPFGDVKADAYYRKAVLWAVEHHVTSGTTKTTFSPNQPCTRAQVVTFLYKARDAFAP